MHQDDVERRLSNWARWYWSGGRVGQRGAAVVSSVYSQGPRGRRAGVSMPVIDGEAIDTHDAIERLQPELRGVLRARYLRIGLRGRSLAGLTERQVARCLDCSAVTFLARLRTAKHMLASELTACRLRRSKQAATPLADSIMTTDTA